MKKPAPPPAKVKPTPLRNLIPEMCQRLSRDLLAVCKKTAENVVAYIKASSI